MDVRYARLPRSLSSLPSHVEVIPFVPDHALIAPCGRGVTVRTNRSNERDRQEKFGFRRSMREQRIA